MSTRFIRTKILIAAHDANFLRIFLVWFFFVCAIPRLRIEWEVIEHESVSGTCLHERKSETECERATTKLDLIWWA